jgi:AcrR family transcriptional regulator
MAAVVRPVRATRLTPRGAETRARIVEAAADLVYAQGVAQTNVEEILEASRTSKSQLYHYFADRDALIREVITVQTRRILRVQEPELHQLDTMRGLREWGKVVVESAAALGGVGGCPLGSLASELADQSDDTRTLLEHCFETWMGYLVEGLQAMRARGALRPSATPHDLATAIMVGVQGGLLLAQTMRDTRPLELALEMAFGHVEEQMS